MKNFIKIIIYILYILSPFVGFSQKNCVTLEHNGYVSIFDTTLKYPLMVSWIDTKERCSCNQIPRKDQFAPDPLLREYTNIQCEYDNLNKREKSKNLKGFDRGHMSPAADNQCPMTINKKIIQPQTLQSECFYFSNMVAQYHSLNAGDWKKLEERTRQLAVSEDSVYVWCGSIGVLMKSDKMSVPTKCWKVLYIKKTKTYECYIFNNTTDKPSGLENWKVPLEEVQKLSGYKFTIN